jgi:LmbE family N-acetylglucosaminyl deacetylase
MGVIMPTDSFGTILAIWTHPDDEILLSAGLMSLAARDGHRVVSVVATKGEKKSWGDKFKPLSPLGNVREVELLSALSILGIKEHHTLGYIDGACNEVNDQEAATKIAAIIKEVNPDSILTFGPDGLTGDPDHQAISRWVKLAFDSSAKPGSNLYYATVSTDWATNYLPKLKAFNFFLPGFPHATPIENLAINFSMPQDILNIKMSALSANVTQIGAMLAYFGKDTIKNAMSTESYILGVTHP